MSAVTISMIIIIILVLISILKFFQSLWIKSFYISSYMAYGKVFLNRKFQSICRLIFEDNKISSKNAV